MGWIWNGLFSYMKKSKTFSPPHPEQASKGAQYINTYDGYSGLVQVIFPQLGSTYGGPQPTNFINTIVGLIGIKGHKDSTAARPTAFASPPSYVVPFSFLLSDF
ncbi:hypothetical protein FPV67DRAFT_1666765 [Lyophyllum atratum]|nr:hypothetical protein FPV67DRAFT_1666765 [Lyophyllum atratum]